MGLPVERLIVATNENDILARALAGGVYKPLGVKATQSPSMDIQVSSNFERLLFEALRPRRRRACAPLMGSLKQSGEFTIPAGGARDDPKRFRRDARLRGSECAAEIARAHRESGITLDPHTAVGVFAARAALRRDPATPIISLATAHPAKFPDAVQAATAASARRCRRTSARSSRRPNGSSVLPNDARAVADFVRERARAIA